MENKYNSARYRVAAIVFPISFSLLVLSSCGLSARGSIPDDMLPVLLVLAFLSIVSGLMARRWLYRSRSG
jgi:hypothetical protein